MPTDVIPLQSGPLHGIPVSSDFDHGPWFSGEMVERDSQGKPWLRYPNDMQCFPHPDSEGSIPEEDHNKGLM